MNQKDKINRQLSMYSFMLDDIILFLDTHPNNSKALAAFGHYKRLYEAAKLEYEAVFGPLTAKGSAEISDVWLWSTTPWPWESEVTK